MANTTASYQEALQDLYADHIGDIHSLTELILPSTDQSAPTVNMVRSISLMMTLCSRSWRKIRG
jgi:hypothetical protein